MKNPNWRKCLLHGDSRDVIKMIPDNSIDFILTDPPYNLGKHSTGNIPLPGRSAMNNDVAQWDMVDFNPEEWADEFIRILKPTGNLFIFTSYNQLGRWYNCLDHRFDTSNFMIWHKTNPAPKIFKAGFLNSCEMIFTCWNKKHAWNFISQAEMHNFIESSICMRPERLSDPKHPAQKPVGILKKMIQIASNADDIVFDPFMGVGSTGVAAIELGRKFIGVEIDETYYNAAKKRIDSNLLSGKGSSDEEACEPDGTYANDWHQSLASVFPASVGKSKKKSEVEITGLSPIVKWPGGKEKELKYILPNLPQTFDRYIEPFVGGGSVFMAVDGNKLCINDFSSDLMALYRYIAVSDPNFFKYCREIDASSARSDTFFAAHSELVDWYMKYRNSGLTAEGLKDLIKKFCKDNSEEIKGILSASFSKLPCVLVKETEKNLVRKMLRMKELEQTRHELPLADIHDNIITAIRSALFMNYRAIYNDLSMKNANPQLYAAVYLYIRNYAYSGMFRFSSKGEFNVPYGGIAYNKKTLSKKLDYYMSEPVVEHFGHTELYCLDFEEFLDKVSPKSDDFIFLDPPYDTEFSTYDKNPFGREDQERLARYLIEKCRAKWMLVIKNTDFIYGLYNKPGVNIRAIDKEYTVSFMNRNDRKTTHLLITNY